MMAKMNLNLTFSPSGGMMLDSAVNRSFVTITHEQNVPATNHRTQMDALSALELNHILAAMPRHTLCSPQVMSPLPLSAGTGRHNLMTLSFFHNMIVAHTDTGKHLVISHNTDVPFDSWSHHWSQDLTYPIACDISAVSALQRSHRWSELPCLTLRLPLAVCCCNTWTTFYCVQIPWKNAKPAPSYSYNIYKMQGTKRV